MHKNVFKGLLAVIITTVFVAGCAEPGKLSRFDVEDRLEIINVLNSYPHNIDHGLVDEYVQLFSEDAVFEIRFPGAPPISMAGHAQISPLAEGAKARKESGGQRRHLFANVIFHEQTDTSASVSCYLLLASTADQKELTFEFTGQYDGWLVKEEGGWKISKWVLHSDRGLVAPAAAPEEPAVEEQGSDAP